MGIKQYIIVGILMFSTDISFSQDFNYRWIEETGEITSFEKHIFSFNYAHKYDVDFEKSNDYIFGKYSILIEKKDRYSKGRLILLMDGEKISAKILSCYYQTYRNSIEKYYQFKCEGASADIILYFILDNDSNSDWRFWMKITEDERLYFTKNNHS